jgi:ElaB/YqjD/DUF883 family membrane-anchored ribosome-binding protein
MTPTTANPNPKLMNELNSSTETARQFTKETAEQGSEKLNQLRTRLTATVESAKATLHKLEEKTIDAAKATDHCIREHPYQTIGLAFGVGLLVGILVTRK